MVLLEILEGQAQGSSIRFLCEIPVRSTVAATISHVGSLRHLRAALDRAVKRVTSQADGQTGVGSTPDPAALVEASTLLSSSTVQRKLVLTTDRLQAALSALEPDTSEGVCEEVAGACLTFAMRTLELDKLLCDYVGSNEKSKIRLGFTLADPATDTAAEPSSSSIALRQAEITTATITGGKRLAPVEASAEASTPCAESPPRRKRREEAVDDVDADLASPSDRAPGVSLMSFWKQRTGQAPATADPGDTVQEPEVDEDLPILSASQAAALSSSADVRAALRSTRLAEALRHVDSAGTREAALRRLELALEDPEFEALSLKALETIGWGHADAMGGHATRTSSGA